MTDTSDIANLSGVDFEAWIAALLRKQGVTKVQATKGSGDQGGDIIFTHCGLRVVVQAKRYSSPVSNKAIQEVYSAMPYYSCDEGWVITNSSFTTAAKDLAKITNVKLIDGSDLRNFSLVFANHFKDHKASHRQDSRENCR